MGVLAFDLYESNMYFYYTLYCSFDRLDAVFLISIFSILKGNWGQVRSVDVTLNCKVKPFQLVHYNWPCFMAIVPSY